MNCRNAILEELDHWTTALRLADLRTLENGELDQEHLECLAQLSRATLQLSNAIAEFCEDDAVLISESVELRRLALQLKHALQKATALTLISSRSGNIRDAVSETTRICQQLRESGRTFCGSQGIALAEWFDATQRA